MTSTTMTRDEILTERTRVLTEQTNPQPAESTAVRVYYVLAGHRNVSFDPDPKLPESHRRFQVQSPSTPIQAVSGHRTRKALAVMLDKFVARGVLTKEDVDEILLAAVDYCEPKPGQVRAW